MTLQFSESVTQAFEEAFQSAQQKSHIEVSENHLLRALLVAPQSYFASICSTLQIDPQILLKQVEASLEQAPSYAGAAETPRISIELQRKVQEAEKIAKKWGDTYLSSDHLFLAYWEHAEEPFAAWKKISKRKTQEVEAEIQKLRGAKLRGGKTEVVYVFRHR